MAVPLGQRRTGPSVLATLPPAESLLFLPRGRGSAGPARRGCSVVPPWLHPRPLPHVVGTHLLDRFRAGPPFPRRGQVVRRLHLGETGSGALELGGRLVVGA